MPTRKQNDPSGTYRPIKFTAVNNADVTDYLQLSDMNATFTIYITKPDGTVSVPSGAVVTQYGSGTVKGLMQVALNAADYDQLGESVLTIMNTGGSKTMRRRDMLINVISADQYAAYTAANVEQWKTKTVPPATVDGVPIVDPQYWKGKAVLGPSVDGVPRTQVYAMESATIKADTFAAGAITLAAFAADALLNAFGITLSGTAAGGSTLTMVFPAAASTTDGAYVNSIVLFTGGPGATQAAQIDSYVGGTRTATFKTAVTVAPTSATTFVVFGLGAAATSPSSGALAAAVWSAIAEGSFQYGDLMRLLASIAAGQVTDFTTGTLVFKAISNAAKTRWTSTDAATGRLATTPGDLTP